MMDPEKFEELKHKLKEADLTTVEIAELYVVVNRKLNELEAEG